MMRSDSVRIIRPGVPADRRQAVLERPVGSVLRCAPTLAPARAVCGMSGRASKSLPLCTLRPLAQRVDTQGACSAGGKNSKSGRRSSTSAESRRPPRGGVMLGQLRAVRTRY